MGGIAATPGRDDRAALRPLAVDFHEPGFAAGVNGEDAFIQQRGFDFQLSDRDRQQAKDEGLRAIVRPEQCAVDEPREMLVVSGALRHLGASAVRCLPERQDRP